MEELNQQYERAAVRAFITASKRHTSLGYGHTQGLIGPFLNRFWPVLRHYRPETVGACLAAEHDAGPEAGTPRDGFARRLNVGNHPADRGDAVGNFADDGAHLAAGASAYFRQESTR